LTVRIGSVEIDNNLLLSPLAGYTDLVYRCLIRPLGGIGLCFTEFVNPRGIINGSSRSIQLVETAPDDRPLTVQLFGTDADELADAAVWAAERGSVTVDINFGCPVPKVAGKGGGSGVLRHCPDAVRIARTVVNKCPCPVTVKTRLGWEMGDLVAPNLARQLEDVGVAALTIHGRYGMQKFAGSVDLDGIRAVVQAVKNIPVFGNGDIQTPHDAHRMIDQTGCAGVMIGRRALGDLWIFRDVHAYLTTGVVPPPPTRLERTRKMIEHFYAMVAHSGPERAVIDFRKRITPYTKFIGPCPSLRRGIPAAKSIGEWEDLVFAFVEEIEREPVDAAVTYQRIA
jgi:nifR3 family TIM-barrel protein